MRVELSDDASLDLVRACEFYRAHGAALPARFLRSIREDLRELRTIAGIHEIHHGFHARVVVHAILDCRRDPASAEHGLGRRR